MRDSSGLAFAAIVCVALGIGLGVPLSITNARVSRILSVVDPSTTPECTVEYLYRRGFDGANAFEEKVAQCLRTRYDTAFRPASLEGGEDDLPGVNATCRRLVEGNNRFWQRELEEFLRFADHGVPPRTGAPIEFAPNSVGDFCMAVTTERDVSDFLRYPQCEAYFAMVAQVAGRSDETGASCTLLHLRAICDKVHRYMTMYKKSLYCHVTTTT